MKIRTILPFILRAPEAGESGGSGGTSDTNAGGAPPAAGAPAGAPQAQGKTDGEGRAANGGQFEPNWLNDRIAQAKRAAQQELLQTLGITSADEAKKFLAEGKKAIDATKTELERKDEEVKALRTVAKEAETLKGALAKRAEAELQALPEPARERIKALAGDDPVKQLEAIDLARAMGAASAPAPTASGQGGQSQPAQSSTPAQGARPAAPPPASTTGAAGSPPSVVTSPTDHLAVWKDMQGKNPLAAAHYYLANQAAIVEQQQKNDQ